jgi:hypothetical protein
MRIGRFAGALLALSLGGCSLSNAWVLPDTPEARECGSACREGHSACVDGSRGGTAMRGPVAGSSTEQHESEHMDLLSTSLYKCQEQMDLCLSLCPGAKKKE